MGQFDRKEKSQRKHPPSNSGASKAPPALPNNRPGWKGPGYVKKTARPASKVQSKEAAVLNIQPQLLPTELQQLLLNIFRTTFPISQDPEALKPVLQEIKSALFERDFERAFGKEEWLEAYAVRWSPSRVLGYANLLASVMEEVREERWVRGFIGKDGGGLIKRTRVVCIGGGAAEVAAFGGLVRFLKPQSCGVPEDLRNSVEKLQIEDYETESTVLDLHLVDSAPWGNVVSKLHRGLETPPPLSKYASASARASNASFLKPGAVSLEFTQADTLKLDTERLTSIIGDGPVMITLFFTLNELYTTNVIATTKFLLDLSITCRKDSLLCVIDSAGSYSEVAITKHASDTDITDQQRDEEPSSTQSEENEDEPDNSASIPLYSEKPVPFADSVNEDEAHQVASKRYPMHWLMDCALLGTGTEDQGLWEKLVIDESRWHRLEEPLKYPISLENMRFQVHLFRRK
ncbi:hypothetical protein B0O99DRAFT_632472 [Bisporella sp. PMI_857]|nr:hypothetical protein B0O99DRAFT_632472 [Bisporella sp. PMI_857]